MSCPGAKQRLIDYAVPYWRRLTLVLVLSLLSTGLSLLLPYLSKGLIDRALLGRDSAALFRILGLFVAITVVSFLFNLASGLRYTRVSAEILFDMRVALYQHLQLLSPRFYARTRMGEIVSRINNDIGEIQRIAAETALAWVGNVLFLVGSVAALLWLDARLFLLSVALLPASVWALTHYRKRLEGKVAALRQASADIGSFLSETLQGMKLVVTSNAQSREVERFRRKNQTFIDALMSMQLLTYLSGGLPGLILSGSTLLVFLYGGHLVIERALTLGTFVAFLSYQMRLFPPVQSLMGLYASMASARVSLARVNQIFETVPEVIESPNAALLAVVGTSRSRAFLHLRPHDWSPRGYFGARAGRPRSSPPAAAIHHRRFLLRLLDPDQACPPRCRDSAICARRLRRHTCCRSGPSSSHALWRRTRYARPDATPAELERRPRRRHPRFIAASPGLTHPLANAAPILPPASAAHAIARAFSPTPPSSSDEPTAPDPVNERQVTPAAAFMAGLTTDHPPTDLAARAARAIVLASARIVEAGTPASFPLAGGAFSTLFTRAALAQ